ncbi:MAG: hypothetical protein NC124_01580 [Clostridium sp.]|nr:hypothetical protein [Clostridium sp.]
MAEFVRLAEVVNKKKDMRIVSVTVAPAITDCSGRIWFTDLQLQEGTALTGFAPHAETALRRYREDGEIKEPVWFNGIVRSKETVILFNLGKTSAPLDIHIYPKSDMAAGTVKLSQGVGGQRVSFPGAVQAGDDVALLADARVCTKNGAPFKKDGFFQYSAAWDSKHNVEVEPGKTARLLFSMQEMEDGEVKF